MKKFDDSRRANATKLERKLIEKNRRNQLKALYQKLFSLLPNDHSLRALPLPDQLDETTKCITSLQIELEKSKQKKQEVLQNVNRTLATSSISSSSPPVIQVLEDTGSGVDAVLINGLDNMSVFHDTIRVVHEQGYQVSSLNFQLNGNSMLQIVHQEGFDAAALCEKLKQVVNRSSSSCIEAMGMESLDSWDYDIDFSDFWGFHFLESFQEQVINPKPE